VARFVADAANDAADLDLYVYRYSADGSALVALAGQSAPGSADETVTLFEPQAAKYLIVVEGYAAAPGETSLNKSHRRAGVGPPGVTPVRLSGRGQGSPLPTIAESETVKA